MKPLILFRKSLAEEGELKIAQDYFDVVETRAEIWKHKDPLVIPRYSALPYYNELEKDVNILGGKLINSYSQHRYVADLQNWYADLADLTPRTWFRPEDVPTDEPGPFVLKGATNSRKHKWHSHMFANTRQDIGKVLCNLLDDPLIAEQGVYVRKWEDFQNFGKDLSGIPITEEFRYFCLDGKILAEGFYWSEHLELFVNKVADWLDGDKSESLTFSNEVGPRRELVFEILRRIKDRIRFVVVDVARHVDGCWRLVELNDGCMSGLSCVDPGKLYRNLAASLREMRGDEAVDDHTAGQPEPEDADGPDKDEPPDPGQ